MHMHMHVWRVSEGSIELVNEAITMQKVKKGRGSLFGIWILGLKREGMCSIYYGFIQIQVGELLPAKFGRIYYWLMEVLYNEQVRFLFMSLFTCFEWEGGNGQYAESKGRLSTCRLYRPCRIADSTVKSWGKVRPILHEVFLCVLAGRHRGLFSPLCRRNEREVISVAICSTRNVR